MSPIAPGGCGVPHTGRQIGVGIGGTDMGSGRGGGWIGGWWQGARIRHGASS